MPYTKTITIYSKQERKNFHARGIWIDRDGNQIPVRYMNSDRLEKLIKMLLIWALDSDNFNGYLTNLPIFVHVVLRIKELGLNTNQSEMFLDAYRFQYE